MFIMSLFCTMSVAAAPLSITPRLFNASQVILNDTQVLSLDVAATKLAVFPTVVVNEVEATSIPETLPIFDFPFVKI
ncbi:hypothetical protein C8R46DRAFT_1116064 [Mycena filopes]|nr:hypothetical protein C8R46DRAFT_1116064 [Mycena filopes]